MNATKGAGDIDIRQLIYFDRICECGSIAKASQLLYVSQQGLSTSIKRMEKELDVKLFERTPKGVVLTEEGALIRESTSRILAEYEAILASILQVKQQRNNTLRVCASFGVMIRLSEYLPAKFQHAFPNICLQIRECPDRQCEKAVEDGICDIGFTSGQVDDTLFEAMPLFTTPIVAIAHHKNHLTKHASIDIAQLRHETIYMMNRQYHTNQKFLDRCHKEGFYPNIAYETEEMGVVFNAVRNNLGIGIVNDYTAQRLITSDIKVVPINDPSFIWDVSLIQQKKRCGMHASRVFVEFLKRSLALE